MPPAQRKRKAAAVEEPAPAPPPAVRSSRRKSINTSAGTVKLAALSNAGKKRKTAHHRGATPPPQFTAKSPQADKKRKRAAVLSDDDDDEIVVCNTRPTDTNASAYAKATSTPRNKRVKHALPPTPSETPSKSAAALFDRLKIDANSRAIALELPRKQLTYDTPPKTPTEGVEMYFSFPCELQYLLEIHGCFLAALSMHYSHNGTASPVSLNELLPMITKHWKKRAVTQTDLQRILALGPKQERTFVLEDFGRAGIRLSKAESRGRILKRASSYIDEEELNSRFESALQKAWHTWQSNTAKENRNAATFLAQLPLLEITPNQAAEKASPLFARGQQRLADFKAGQAAKTESKITLAQPTPQKVPQSLETRGTALLDRILAKQQLASSLPAGPTRTQLERKSALQRIEDVARVLSLMCGMKERSSFSMQVIIQQLQQSLRNPINQVEVWRCLSLMSTEIMPGFVRLVQSGEVQGVVITRSGNIELGELRAKVAKAGA